MMESFEDMGTAQFNANTEAVDSGSIEVKAINKGVKDSINAKNTNLIEKNKINRDQEKAILKKQKLFLTRSRMLQVSRDKNAYKTKIIYTLLALILFIFMASLGIYVFLKKTPKNSS